MTVEVGRSKVLAYRVRAQGLTRATRSLNDLSVFDLGVQNTPPGSARMAVAARMKSPMVEFADSFTMAWSLRGAPHVHRTDDLAGFAAALWPRDDDEALDRLTATAPKLTAAKIAGRVAWLETAKAMRAEITHPMQKGEASARVTARAPGELSSWCQACEAHHIYEELFRLAALPAGVRVESDRPPLKLAPIEGWPGIPSGTAGLSSLIGSYLRLHGPATPTEVAAFLGTAQHQVRRDWPRGLVEVGIEGRRAWLPESQLEDLRRARPVRFVRLLPPSDPFLQARDRDFLVPEKSRRATLWRFPGSPGALFLDGEIAGIWRARLAAKARLEITVMPFGRLAKATRPDIEAEVERLAIVRGAKSSSVGYKLT